MHPTILSLCSEFIIYSSKSERAASFSFIFYCGTWKVGHKIYSHIDLLILCFRSLLERDELVNIRWELWEVTVLLVAFVVAQFAFYACLPYLLKLSSATALNLNLLATDYYNIVAGMVFFKYKVVYLLLFMYRKIAIFA